MPTHKDIQEDWKAIEGFERYYVSSLGRIKSTIGKEKILKPQTIHNGYQQVTLRAEGKKYNRLIHRLVAMAFIPTDDVNKEVHHKNRIRTDNRADNLQWLSREEHCKIHRQLDREGGEQRTSEALES